MPVTISNSAKRPQVRVSEFLHDNPNEEFHVNEIADLTGLTIEQASNAAALLIRGSALYVERPRKGVYRYCPPAPPVLKAVPSVTEVVEHAAPAKRMATVRTEDGQYVTGLVQAEWEA